MLVHKEWEQGCSPHPWVPEPPCRVMQRRCSPTQRVPLPAPPVTHSERVSSKSSHTVPHLTLIAPQRDEGDVTQPGVLLPPRRPHLGALRGPQGPPVLGTEGTWGGQWLFGPQGPLRAPSAALGCWDLGMLGCSKGGSTLSILLPTCTWRKVANHSRRSAWVSQHRYLRGHGGDGEPWGHRDAAGEGAGAQGNDGDDDDALSDALRVPIEPCNGLGWKRP